MIKTVRPYLLIALIMLAAVPVALASTPIIGLPGTENGDTTGPPPPYPPCFITTPTCSASIYRIWELIGDQTDLAYDRERLLMAQREIAKLLEDTSTLPQSEYQILKAQYDWINRILSPAPQKQK